MSPFKYLIAAIVLITGIVSVAPVALAQTNVVTIDEGRILRDSRAGKDMRNKLKNIETQMKNELDPTRRSLETEGKSLESRTQGKTREALAADSALISQIQSYQRKAGDFAQKRQKAQQELRLTERKALIAFNKALEPVMQEVVREKSAQIVLSKGQVVFAAPSVDVTSSVISKLDSRTPSISVTRERLPTTK